MKALRILFPILLVFLLFTACAPSDGNASEIAATPNAMTSPKVTKSSGNFTLPYFSQVGLNPYTCLNSTNNVFFPLIWESLFTLDKTFNPVPLLCESCTMSQDGRFYTLKLRDSVNFSDGTYLSAADVVYSLNAARGAGSQYATRLSGVTRVSQEGELTVGISLSSPNGGLPALLDMPIVKNNSLDGAPIGSGPYGLTGTMDSYSLAVRTDWWQKSSLPLKTIRLSNITESDQLVYGMRTYELDLTTTDFTGINAPGYSGDYQVWDYPTTNMIYLGLNTRSGALTDLALRRALSLGIDRGTILSTCFFRHGQAAALPVSPSSKYYDTKLAGTLSYSPRNMEDALKKAGYIKERDTNGDGYPDESVMTSLTLRLLVCSDNQSKCQAADAISQSLEANEIHVTVKKLPFEEYESALKSGSFDLYLAETRLTADFDLTALLGSGGSLNFGGYQNAAADTLLNALKASSGDQRAANSTYLYTLLSEDAPIIPILFKNNSVLTHRDALSGLNPASGNVFNDLEKWTFS